MCNEQKKILFKMAQQHIDKDISKWSHNDLSHWVCNSVPYMNDFIQQWNSHLIDGKSVLYILSLPLIDL